MDKRLGHARSAEFCHNLLIVDGDKEKFANKAMGRMRKRAYDKKRHQHFTAEKTFGHMSLTGKKYDSEHFSPSRHGLSAIDCIAKRD